MNHFLIVLSFLSSLAAHAQTPEELPPVEVRCQMQASVANGPELGLRCNEGEETTEASTEELKSSPRAVARSSYSPFSLVLQTGEYAGLVSPGVAFRFFKRNEATLLGGFVPGKIDGQQLWQANFKYQVEPFNDIHIRLKNGESVGINPIHLGAGIVYGIHKNLFYNQPSQYPAGYYMPTAVRVTFNFGTSVSYRKITLYVDYVALDTGAISYFFDKNGQFYRDNYAMFGLAGIGTLGFGAKFNLNHRAKSNVKGMIP